jgi:hypothetical protein
MPFADGKTYEGAMQEYVQQACRIQKELVNRQTRSVNTWYSPDTYVSSIKRTLDEQLGKAMPSCMLRTLLTWH